MSIIYQGVYAPDKKLVYGEEENESGKIYFSHDAGFYDSTIRLRMETDPGWEIYYTTDGSIPSVLGSGTTKKYDGPITLENRSHLPPVLSRGVKVDLRFNSEYTPPDRVRQANIIRAVAADRNGRRGKLYTNTYFIGILKSSDAQMGFISVVGDPHELFDWDEGIYYQIHTNRIRADVNTEYFTPYRERVFSYDGHTRVFGGFTRNFAQKSMKLIFNEGTESNTVNYPLFGNFSRDVFGNTIDSFKRVRLHSGGNDSKHTTFIDGMIMDLSKDMNMAVNPFMPVITFINGEYWGLYALREDYKSDFFHNRFHVDYSNVIALKIVWGSDNVPDITTGRDEDARYYEEMFNYLENYDFSNDVVYNHFADYYVDIDSFIDFYIANLYVNNIDWPGNNVRMWRTREKEPGNPYADTRWRFILHDVDAGMKDQNTDMFENLLRDESSGRAGSPPYDYWATLMFRRLTENEGFVEEFTNRFLVHLNTTYEKNHVLETIREYSRRQQPSVDEHKARWGQTEAYPYRNAVGQVTQFAMDRDRNIISLLDRHFGTGPARKVELSGFDGLENTRIYLGPSEMDVSDKSPDMEIYAFHGTELRVVNYDRDVKGYLVYRGGSFEYIKEQEISILVDDTMIKIIPITFSIVDYIFSAEGIILMVMFACLAGIMVFTFTRKRKKEKWTS